jgi:tripartite-type tricarboxylate transporter receptor subunit TctC
VRPFILKALSLCAVAGAAFVPAPAAAFPDRPIELIVPWGPGGGADQLARITAKLMEPTLKQGVPVVNVPGGTGATGMAKLLAAPADGHAMAIYIADSHALLAGKDARWSMDDIIPVAVMIQGPSFLFVAQDSRFKTWADFEKEAKASPGKLKVATLGFGSVDDFSLGVLDRGGVKVVQVPFSKPSERYVSILGGHADALYEQAGDVAQFLGGKQMRPLLMFGQERYAAFNDVPSSYEAGSCEDPLRRARQGGAGAGVQEVPGGPVRAPEQFRGRQQGRGLRCRAAGRHEERHQEMTPEAASKQGESPSPERRLELEKR